MHISRCPFNSDWAQSALLILSVSDITVLSQSSSSFIELLTHLLSVKDTDIMGENGEEKEVEKSKTKISFLLYFVLLLS